MSSEYQIKRDKDEQIQQLMNEIKRLKAKFEEDKETYENDISKHYEQLYKQRCEGSHNAFKEESKKLREQFQYVYGQTSIHMRVSDKLMDLVSYQEQRQLQNCPFYEKPPPKLTYAERAMIKKMDQAQALGELQAKFDKVSQQVKTAEQKALDAESSYNFLNQVTSRSEAKLFAAQDEARDLRVKNNLLEYQVANLEAINAAAMAEQQVRHDNQLAVMKTELKQMYLDMSAECKIKDTVIESLSKKLQESQQEITRMFKMLHYPRMVQEMQERSTRIYGITHENIKSGFKTKPGVEHFSNDQQQALMNINTITSTGQLQPKIQTGATNQLPIKKQTASQKEMLNSNAANLLQAHKFQSKNESSTRNDKLIDLSQQVVTISQAKKTSVKRERPHTAMIRYDNLKPRNSRTNENGTQKLLKDFTNHSLCSSQNLLQDQYITNQSNTQHQRRHTVLSFEKKGANQNTGQINRVEIHARAKSSYTNKNSDHLRGDSRDSITKSMTNKEGIDKSTLQQFEEACLPIQVGNFKVTRTGSVSPEPSLQAKNLFAKTRGSDSSAPTMFLQGKKMLKPNKIRQAVNPRYPSVTIRQNLSQANNVSQNYIREQNGFKEFQNSKEFCKRSENQMKGQNLIKTHTYSAQNLK